MRGTDGWHRRAGSAKMRNRGTLEEEGPIRRVGDDLVTGRGSSRCEVGRRQGSNGMQ